MRLIPLLLLFVHLSTHAAPNYAPRDGRFIDRGQEGWFFYEPELKDLPKPKQEKPEEKPKELVETMEVMPAPEPTAPPMPVETTPETKAPEPLSAEWIRQNMQRYKDATFEEGTPESVASLLYLQKYILDKISKATRAQPVAIMQNPLLDESIRAPIAVGMKRNRLQYNQDQHRKLLETLSKEHGLWVFFDSTDPATEKYIEVIERVKQNHQFEPFYVSIDGQAPPGHPSLEFRIDQGQASALGVIHTPATFLVNPEGDFAPLGQAGMAISTLLERVTLAAQQHGWISDTDYQATQIAKLDHEFNGDDEFIGRLDQYLQDHPHESGFIPPTDFIELLKAETP
jgi:conjugal transfer pilus assembly protein TraF